MLTISRPVESDVITLALWAWIIILFVGIPIFEIVSLFWLRRHPPRRRSSLGNVVLILAIAGLGALCGGFAFFFFANWSPEPLKWLAPETMPWAVKSVFQWTILGATPILLVAWLCKALSLHRGGLRHVERLSQLVYLSCVAAALAFGVSFGAIAVIIVSIACTG